MEKQKNIFFQVDIDDISRQDILKLLTVSETTHYAPRTTQPLWIVTANPEILLFAKKNPTYKETLKHASIRVADGFGLVLMSKLIGGHLQRVIGVDLAEDLVKWASENQKSVCFIGGGSKHSAQPALDAMKKRFPSLQGFAEDGGTVDADGMGDDTNEEARMRITMQKPNVVLVGFGHPKQERWIEKNLLDVPGIDVIIGVGGTFDYWSGLTLRAPKWIRTIGFEWLFRLIIEPKRIGRILRAVFVFPIEVALDRMK